MQNVMRAVSVAMHATICIADDDHDVKWWGRAETPNKVRDESTWVQDYLAESPVYNQRLFRRRFGVPLQLFWRIHEDLVKFDPHFWGTRFMVGGRKGKDSRIKVLACMRLLRTGVVYDQLEDGAIMGEETVRCYIQRFTTDMRKI